MTAPQAAATCARCPHPLTEHGAGCTSGWLQHGPECHCPNDYDGNNAHTSGRECGKSYSHPVHRTAP